MSVQIIQGNALALPLEDDSVDLVVTSPPYFGLRSYTDAGEHYDGQIGSEPTPAEFIAALLAATREMVRVVKPSGSIWVNLGDKYSQRTQTRRSAHQPGMFPGKFEEFGETWAERAKAGAVRMPHQNIPAAGVTHVPEKSLMGLPWRYAIACIDQLGLILRAEVIWSKPNGLPESVTDRVRRSHETWFHFTLQPRYYSAVDTIREPQKYPNHGQIGHEHIGPKWSETDGNGGGTRFAVAERTLHPLGKLPGSVWSINEGDSLVRSVLTAVSEGGITIDEGERILAWTQDGSYLTSTNDLTDAGSGPGIETPTATPRSRSVAGRSSSSTASPTNCSSAPSPTASQSTTSAATPAAPTPTTSSPSPDARTSDEPTPSGLSASTDTTSQMPTSTSPRPASPTRSAASASSPESDAGESVWVVPTQPLKVPPELGVDHFAAFPMSFPRRIIQGWSPSGICTACGEGRRPVAERSASGKVATTARGGGNSRENGHADFTHINRTSWQEGVSYLLTGEACGCDTPTAPTRPAVILDPFSGTGTTALVAHVLGRHGIGIDMSSDYNRLATWRCNDPGQLASAMQVERPAPVADDQLGFDFEAVS